MAESNKDDKFCKRIDFSSGNMATAWKAFKMQFEVYKVAKKYSDMTAEEQISNMLVQMGNESVPIYAQFVYDDADNNKKKTLNNTIRMFDEYFEPVKNVIYERAKFNTMRQGEKTIHQFIVELQSQADQCDYGDMKNDLIRDRIVVGVKDKKLREYLMDVDDLDLNKCIQKSKQWINNHQQTQKFEDADDDNNLDSLMSKQDRMSRQPVKSEDRLPSREKPCERCNKTFHRGKFCPAKFTSCKACSEKGHWARSPLCKKGSRKINELQSSLDNLVEDADTLFLNDSL